MLAIAVSFGNQCTCSCEIPDSTPSDARTVLDAVCKEQKLSLEDWNEVLVIKDGRVVQYVEEDWMEFED